MNYSILIILYVVSCMEICACQQCDEKGLGHFDATVARLITIGNSGRKFPSSKGEPHKMWCDESERLIRELENYKTQCFKELSRQVASVLIYSIKNVFRQYCRRDSQKLTDLIATVPCVTKNEKIVTKCYTNFIDGALGAKNAVDSKKIPYLCCEYVKTFQCLDKLSTAPSCTEKHVESISDLVRGIVSNAIDLICGDYVEDSDKCQVLGPTPKKKKSQRRTRSFAPPVLELLSSFPPV